MEEDKRFGKGWSLMVGWTRVRVVEKKVPEERYVWLMVTWKRARGWALQRLEEPDMGLMVK